MGKDNYAGYFDPEIYSRFKEVCEGRFDFTRCERPDGTFYGTGGTCRLGVQADPKPQEEKKTRGARETLAAELSKHMKEYSFTMPGRSFDGTDVANMVNEAANLPGEAGENVAKMQFFILKDKQGLWIGETMEKYAEKTGTLGVREFNKKDVPWAMTPEYRTLLERMGHGEALERIKQAESRLSQNKELEKSVKEKIEIDKKYGIDPKDNFRSNELKNIRKQMRDDKEVIKDAPRRLSSFAFAEEGADGSTASWKRTVSVADNGGAFHAGFDKGRKVNAQEIQDGVGKVMSERAKLDELEGSKRSMVAIDTFSGGSPLKSRNEKVLYVYTHEVGHQVYFRAGSPPPPPDSVSERWKERGITGYAATNRDELFAESFALYTFNPKVLKEVDRPLYDWVDSTVNTAMTNAGNPLF